MKKFSVGVLAFGALLTSGAFAETLSVKMLDGENWWGGANCFGSQILSVPCSSCSPPSSLLHAKIHIHFL